MRSLLPQLSGVKTPFELIQSVTDESLRILKVQLECDKHKKIILEIEKIRTEEGLSAKSEKVQGYILRHHRLLGFTMNSKEPYIERVARNPVYQRLCWDILGKKKDPSEAGDAVPLSIQFLTSAINHFADSKLGPYDKNDLTENQPMYYNFTNAKAGTWIPSYTHQIIEVVHPKSAAPREESRGEDPILPLFAKLIVPL